MSIYVNWAAKDFDGSIANAGFDLDLDMNIDVFVEEDFGLMLNKTSSQNETLEIQNSNWKYEFISNNDFCGLIFYTTFAFIAVDDEGDTGIQLVQYVYQDIIDYDDMMDIKYDYPGLFGITDDMEGLFDSPYCEGGPNSAPLAAFFASKDSAGVYHVEVIKVTRKVPLEDFSFFLKDQSGSTYVGGNGFGEIAMQFQGGEEMGIDMTYNGNNDLLKDRANELSSMMVLYTLCTFLTTTKMAYYLLVTNSWYMVPATTAQHKMIGNLISNLNLTGDIIGSARLL